MLCCCGSLRHKYFRIEPLQFQQRVRINSSTNKAIQNFFGFGQEERHHFLLAHHVSTWKSCTQYLSSVTRRSATTSFLDVIRSTSELESGLFTACIHHIRLFAFKLLVPFKYLLKQHMPLHSVMNMSMFSLVLSKQSAVLLLLCTLLQEQPSLIWCADVFKMPGGPPHTYIQRGYVL